jgi:metal-responsive CopG/Arc/MetJ family transcriptional regulator
MEQMTFRVPDDVVKHIDDEASERDVSKSEVARTLLERGIEYDEVESERDQLRNQLQAMSSRNEVDDKLVRYVEHDIEYHEAGIGTKLKWFVFGK